MNIRINGIQRRIDDLGRIAIPKYIRKVLEIKEGQSMDICVINDCILITKTNDTNSEESDNDKRHGSTGHISHEN